jgi:hypothetical protein
MESLFKQMDGFTVFICGFRSWFSSLIFLSPKQHAGDVDGRLEAVDQKKDEDSSDEVMCK